MAIRKLVLSNLTNRKVRVALTVAAIALSVSLVVAVTSGYASVYAAVTKYLTQYMGSTDAQVTRRGDARGTVPETLISQIQADPDVQQALGRLELESNLFTFGGQDRGALAGLGAHVLGIRRPLDKQVETLEMTTGQWFDVARGNVAVIDQVAAARLKVGVGDTFTLPGPNGGLELKVTGIIHKPAILATTVQTIYVPIETLQAFALPDKPGQVSRIMVDLYPGKDLPAFAKRWSSLLEGIDPSLQLKLARDNRQELDKNLQGIQILSYLGGAVAMLSATFIVFSTLSMGVAERSRTLAMLRAIGAYRSHIGWLVICEGLVLAIIGILIGAPLGWLWVELLALRFTTIFSAGVVLSWGGVLFGVIGSLIAALLASFLPAWNAMRVSPLEAMSALGSKVGVSGKVPWRSALAGLMLISIDPFLLHGPLHWITGADHTTGFVRTMQFYLHFILGLPGMMIGFFLLAPLFVWTIERVIGPIVAFVLGIRFALVRQQLSSGMWRAAGTCAALMVGLSILVVMQTQGKTLLGSWRLPDKFPDLFLVSWLALSPEQQKAMETVPGIRNGEVMPIAIAAPELWKSLFSIEGASVLPNATMFFGIDPDKAFDMMELDFRDKDGRSVNPKERDRLEAQAKEMLKKGRHIIVTDEYRQLKGLGVGDTLTLKTSENGVVDYTIAGVVWSPGIDVIVSMFDMGRQFDQRTAASVFGTLDDAKRDFGVRDVRVFAANLDFFVEKDELVERVRTTVLDRLQAVLGKEGIVAGDVRQIKANIQQGFTRLLNLASTVAIAAMAVASLGVMNTIMASIRSRRWQFGVLRSIGVTQGQLLRLVLAEAILLGLVGCALGITCGLLMSVDASALNRTIIGYGPPMAVPWDIVWLGAAVVMAISIIASIGPALRVASTQPLTLLQAGRAAA